MTLLTSELLPTKTYPFSTLRYQDAESPVQEGAWGLTDFLVIQRALGANMSVDVSAGDAWIQGDDAVRQGFYHQINDAAVNVAIAANGSGNPRLDQLVLQMADSSVLGGSDTPQLLAVQGTPSAGATLANRTGAAALPNTALRLADIIVANGAASIVTANIRDRRLFAPTALFRYLRNGGDVALSSATSWAAFDAANLAPRIECSGKLLRVTVAGWAGCAGSVYGRATIDGAAIDGLDNGAGTGVQARLQAGNSLGGFVQHFFTVPSAGSHQFGYQTKGDGANAGTMFANAGCPLYFAVQELRTPQLYNNPSGGG